MLTGRPPFYSKDQLNSLEKKTDKQIPIPNKLSNHTRSFLGSLLKIKVLLLLLKP
jgi:hypothetical protein